MKTKIYKQIIALLVVVISSFSFSSFANNAEPIVTVFVDGEQILFDVDPIIENGRTLVPMRFIFEALDAKVEWVDETSTAIAIKDDTKIEITIGENKMLINGEEIELDVPAKLINDRTLVPVRAVSEGLNAKVDWDGELFKVIITSGTSVYSTYEANQLSPADMELLKDTLSDFRYSFEQQILFEDIALMADDTLPTINAKDTKFADSISVYWDNILVNCIFQIQLESEYSYLIEDEDEESLIDAYLSILESSGMDAKSNFEVSYEVTADKRTVLLVTFNNVKSNDPETIHCKYIALVPDGNSVRYFTVEFSPINSEMLKNDVYMFCEITEDGRNNYGTIDTDKTTLLKSIDAKMKKTSDNH